MDLFNQYNLDLFSYYAGYVIYFLPFFLKKDILEYPCCIYFEAPDFRSVVVCGNTGSFNPRQWARDGTCTSAATQATAVGCLTHHATAGTPGM